MNKPGIQAERKPLSLYRQDTPRMQIVSLVQAAQGTLLNFDRHADGHVRDRAARALAALDAVQELLRQMPEGQWR